MGVPITVIGGGLAGLVAAIEAAEHGADVTLYEAHSSLGGRGRATAPPYVAHEGPHVFYADGPHWSWLRAHGALGRLGVPSLRQVPLGFRVDGAVRFAPPAAFLRMMMLSRGQRAPVDQDFRSWASERFGPHTAEYAANAIAAATYDADTGRLSAAFVWGLLKRVFAPKVPAVRWVVGGWQQVIHHLTAAARQRGVHIELNSRLSEIPHQPTIVATELVSARRLLGDESLRWDSGHAALLDIAVPRSWRDRFVVFDMDAGGFHESYSGQDRSTVPSGESLFQLDMPVREDEHKTDAIVRLKELADHTIPEWRERATWHRTGVAFGRTGALDLPGYTWHDRPAIDRGDGVFLAGDMVAAPGMRGEISINSAVQAARCAVNVASTNTRKLVR